VTTGWQSLSIDRRQRINVCATEAANRPDRSHLKRIRIIGSQQNGFEYPYEALDFVAQGKVKTIVETYPLADAPKAYDRVAQGRSPISRRPSNAIVHACFARDHGQSERNEGTATDALL
jgi:hypothetical protein